jgi:hypothetical protein
MDGLAVQEQASSEEQSPQVEQRAAIRPPAKTVAASSSFGRQQAAREVAASSSFGQQEAAREEKK